MRIKRRRLLILILSGSQLACLAFGVAWATGWLRAAFDNIVRARSVVIGQTIALELAQEFDDSELASLEPGTPGWRRAQVLCEESQTAAGGFAAVMRADNGALLCHPQLSHDPRLLQEFPGRSMLRTPHCTAPLVEVMRGGGDSRGRVLSGTMISGAELFQVAAYPLPKLNALIAVYQSEAGIEYAVAQLVHPVTQAGYVLTSFIVGVTSIATVFLLNRHEDNLASANKAFQADVEERTVSLLRARNAVVFGLAKLADSRGSDPGRHLDQIRLYVTILASELAKNQPTITPQYVADLAVASSLHDIGKIGVPDAVLMKPGRLSPAERKAMQLHTLLGSECLASIQTKLGDDEFLTLAQQIAMSHHEHWDGSGYPQGLQGEQIPLSARIVALADVYDALTSKRPYKGPIGHDEAKEWIAARYGTQFDPDVVEAFIEREADFARILAAATEVSPTDADETSVATGPLASEPTPEDAASPLLVEVPS
ncbi:MAG: HD domain-containing phosphohydrolase [Planctomycetota bacterium]